MDVRPTVRRKILMILLLGLGLSAPVQAEAIYSVTNLGPLNGRSGQGLAINELGHVTGYMEPSSVAFGYGYAFLYSAGLSKDLGTLGGHASRGHGLNDLDQVVGSSYIPPAPGSAVELQRAFLYSGGQMTDLGGNASVAKGINNQGAITGTAYTATNESHAFLYSAGVMSDLGTLGGSYSVGNAINNNGQVTGTSNLAPKDPSNPLSYETHAFLYSGGAMVDLGTLGGSTSSGEAINIRGDVTGASTFASGATHAFLYSGGAMIDLGALGNDYSLGWGINDRGDVVGTTRIGAGVNVHHAFLRSASDGVMQDLNNLIDPASGWVLSYALDINNTGQITGHGTFNGIASAFLLTPGYQIKPNPNPQGGIIQVDNAPHGYYNGETFINQGFIGIDLGGDLKNRSGAQMKNYGTLQNGGAFAINSGSNLTAYGSSNIVNNRLIQVMGSVEDYGTTINARNMSLYDGVYVYAGTGGNRFFNSGVVSNDGGTFVVKGEGVELIDNTNSGMFINHHKLEVRDGARFVCGIENGRVGSVSVFSGGFLYGTLTNRGVLSVDDLPSAAAVQFNNTGTFLILNGASLSSRIETIADGDTSFNSGEINLKGKDSRLAVTSGAVFENSLGGKVTAEAATKIYINASSRLANLGSITTAGRLDVFGHLDNEQSAVLNVEGQDARLRVDGSLENNGTVKVMGGELNIAPSGRLFGNGVVNLTNGKMIVDGSFDGNTLNAQNSVLMGSNRIGPSATINLSACKLNAGNSPGTLSIDGTLNMDIVSTVIVEIASPDDYDRLVLGGVANFDDTQVEIVSLDGYRPDAAETFEWLKVSGAWNGSFSYTVPPDWTVSSVQSPSGESLGLAYDSAYELASPPMGEDIGIPQDAVAFIGENNHNLDSYAGLSNAGVLHIRENAALWSGGQLTNRGGSWLVNRGRLDLSASHGQGHLENAGTVYNHATGTLVNEATFNNAQAARLLNRGLLNNLGTGTLINHGLVDNHGEIDNSGSIENQGDFVIAAEGRVKGDGRYYQLSGATRVDGVLAPSDAAGFSAGILTGRGRLAGQVNLGDIFGSPTVQPGNAIGILTVEGALSVYNALFEIGVAGVTDHDHLAVSGTAEFVDGEVAFLLQQGYTPAPGHVITWLTTGQGATGLTSLDHAIWNVATDGTRTAWTAPSGLRAVFHGDRLEFIATNSYDTWRGTNAPTTGSDPNADEDADGVTNGAEYVLGGLIGTNDLAKLPTVSAAGDNLVFTFIRDQASIDGSTNVAIEVGGNLSDWPDTYPVPAAAVQNNPGVTVQKGVPAAGKDTVILTLPLAPGGKTFARLTITP